MKKVNLSMQEYEDLILETDLFQKTLASRSDERRFVLKQPIVPEQILKRPNVYNRFSILSLELLPNLTYIAWNGRYVPSTGWKNATFEEVFNSDYLSSETKEALLYHLDLVNI